METICIFCRDPIDSQNKEHIIPHSVIGDPLKTHNALFSYDVCLTCNRDRFGASIDSDFLNSDEIKAIRLLHKKFLPTEVNPSLKIKDISSFEIDGITFSCDLFINKEGHRFIPPKKPVLVGNSRVFIKNEKEIDEFIEKINGQGKYDKIVKPSEKFLIDGQIDLYSVIWDKFKNPSFSLPFSRIFFKMIIEYIAYKFGKRIALKSKYDPIREQALKKNTLFDSKYRFRVICKIPYDVEKLNFIEHTISIKYDNKINLWFFNFLFYGIYDYSFVIPFDDSFSEVIDVVRVDK